MKKIILILSLMAMALLLGACQQTVEINIMFHTNDRNEVVYLLFEEESTFQMPSDPTKEGYIFDGWFWDDITFQEPFTVSSILDQPNQKELLNVYAKYISLTGIYWEEIKNSNLDGRYYQVTLTYNNFTQNVDIVKGPRYVNITNTIAQYFDYDYGFVSAGEVYNLIEDCNIRYENEIYKFSCIKSLNNKEENKFSFTSLFLKMEKVQNTEYYHFAYKNLWFASYDVYIKEEQYDNVIDQIIIDFTNHVESIGLI